MNGVSAIVTGHTRGLGEGIARHLLARKARVLGIARSENEALAEEYGEALIQTRLDLSDTRALLGWLDGGALASFLAGAGRPILINNAGLLQPIGPLDTQEPSHVARAASVNVAAALTLSAAFVINTPDAIDRRILHISSGAGRKGYAGWSVYCASKAALDNHARAVALDRTPRLRISSLAPGVIDTDMQAEIRATTEDLFPDRVRFEAMKRDGRLPAPGDVGRAVVAFLLAAGFGDEPVADLRR
jgi:hypothetical protein